VTGRWFKLACTHKAVALYVSSFPKTDKLSDDLHVSFVPQAENAANRFRVVLAATLSLGVLSSKDKDHEHDTTSERLDRLDQYLVAAVA
jgi:hypothetical protein